MWKGTTPNLKARPQTTNTKPNTTKFLSATPDWIASATAPTSSVPVAPYSMDMPYNNRLEANAPSTKYFIAASIATEESRCKATIVYRLRESSSRPRYRVRKMLAEIITIIPSKANRTSTMNSPVNRLRATRYWREYTSIMDNARQVSSFSTSDIRSSTNMLLKAYTTPFSCVPTIISAQPSKVSRTSR